MTTTSGLPRQLIVSAGMPRAGSAWYFNLTHDLWRAAGGADVRSIRDQYHLQDLMTEVNYNMGSLAARRLLRVLRPLLDRQSFVVKTHSRPLLFARTMIRTGFVKPTYIFRDPRDALLSAFEYGQRVQKNLGRPNAFSKISSIEAGISWVKGPLEVWKVWSRTPRTLLCRYEDLLTDYESQVEKIARFLQLDLTIPELSVVVEKYRPKQAVEKSRGLHLYKGRIGRFREVFTAEQKQMALAELGEFLTKMGYEP